MLERTAHTHTFHLIDDRGGALCGRFGVLAEGPVVYVICTVKGQVAYRCVVKVYSERAEESALCSCIGGERLKPSARKYGRGSFKGSLAKAREPACADDVSAFFIDGYEHRQLGRRLIALDLAPDLIGRLANAGLIVSEVDRIKCKSSEVIFPDSLCRALLRTADDEELTYLLVKGHRAEYLICPGIHTSTSCAIILILFYYNPKCKKKQALSEVALRIKETCGRVTIFAANHNKSKPPHRDDFFPVWGRFSKIKRSDRLLT